MTNLLVKLFVKDSQNIKEPIVRQRYGTMSGLVGIVLNILLFTGKYIAGLLSVSIAITADAFNNLSDAGSSMVTLLGFRLAGQKPDRGHPFGHGRIEYLSGLIVSVAILIVGFELGKSSLDKVLHPEPVEFSTLACGILVVSILIKGWMSLFNRKLGKRINSTAMMATCADSLSDAVATTAVLVGTLVGHFAKITIDGYLGLLVALFILYTGFQSIKDTINPLLGQAPDPQLVQDIRSAVLSHPEILGIHDMIIHDYGPGRQFASLHAEISKDTDIMQAHDVIDIAEREVYSRLGCEISIHMDPVCINDEHIEKAKRQVSEILQSVNPELTFHDFRMTVGPQHTNLIFDVVKPLNCQTSNGELNRQIQSAIANLDGNYFAVITIDTLRV